MMSSNEPLSFEAFCKAEPAVRGFQRFTSEQRSDMQASHRMGYLQKNSVGEAFWTHPRVHGVCFDTRVQARKSGYRAYLAANEFIAA